MFAFFHFAFLIFKIALQAAVYSLVVMLFISIIIKTTGNRRLKSIKFKTAYLSIAALLFIFSFTYYGDHGLGDEANIPIGHGRIINSGDGYAYLNVDRTQINIDSFLVRNNHLYFASKSGYYDYQLPSGKYIKYSSKQEYEAYAKKNHLPVVNDFKTFYPQYDAYWNGWRFWLLP
ncbi:hypothetical protein EOD41_20500 [Mucilaginibacter limnophilus]|uniref:Uncharacterized protein n=1 Tax=Mucilaginibacter limnophilus TaxID=1932778 RepID=A0A3S3TE30_9SPHI|nr:hypothetical protein [Mucilaginibacter limnophilus]RVT96428.1 hypothetical protein EOD41_20500 [Mucilaginibacter limnophilus]